MSDTAGSKIGSLAHKSLPQPTALVHMSHFPQDGENFEALLRPNGLIFSSFLNCLKRICPLQSKNTFVLVLAFFNFFFNFLFLTQNLIFRQFYCIFNALVRPNLQRWTGFDLLIILGVKFWWFSFFRIKMQRGLRCNMDQDSTRINMQRGSRCSLHFRWIYFVSFMVFLSVCCVSHMCCFQLQYDVKQRGNYKILIK